MSFGMKMNPHEISIGRRTLYVDRLVRVFFKPLGEAFEHRFFSVREPRGVLNIGVAKTFPACDSGVLDCGGVELGCGGVELGCGGVELGCAPPICGKKADPGG